MSRFLPYIGALPLYFPGIPLFLSPQILNNFCYPPLNAQVRKKSLVLMELVKRIAENQEFLKLFHSKSVDIHALAWSVAATSTRAFSFDANGEKNKRLLPLIDMMNHSPSPNVKISFDNNLIKAVALKPIKASEELTINYGLLNRDHFLMHYGFFPDSVANLKENSDANPTYPDVFHFAFDWNLFQLIFELSDEGLEIANWREILIKAFYEYYGNTPFSLLPLHQSNGSIDTKLMVLSRILYAPEDFQHEEDPEGMFAYPFVAHI